MYSPWQVTGAALLRGPIGGLWLIADNLRQLGQRRKARTLRVIGFVVLAGLLVFGVYGPEQKSYMVLGALGAALVRQYALVSYGDSYKRHLADGGQRAPHWKWLVVGFAFMAVGIVVFLGYVYGLAAVAPNLLPDKFFEQE